MARTRDDYLDVLHRTCDAAWLAGMLEDPDSAAVIHAFCDQWVRISVAIDRARAVGSISGAPGGRPGVAIVTLVRVATGTGGTIPQGFSFLSDVGTTLVTTVPIPVAIGQATVLLPLVTLRQTEGINTEDDAVLVAQPQQAVADASNATPVVITTHQPHTYATGDIVFVSAVEGNDGANGLYPIVVTSPTTFELTGSVGTGAYIDGGLIQPAPLGLVVATCSPIADGASDYLTAHAKERGIQRQPGEIEEHFRSRVRDIPDAVSPRAIGIAVQGIVNQQKLPFTLVKEPFEDGATPALKADLGLGSFTSFASDVDFLDDPFVVILSNREARAYFLVGVEGVPVPSSALVFFLDSGFLDDFVFGYPDVGADPGVLAALFALWEECNRKRAGGVQFDIFVDVYNEERASGDSAAGAATVVWTLSAPALKAWHFIDGYFAHIAAPGSSMPAGASHQVKFFYEDGTNVTTAPYTDLDSQHIAFADLAALGPVGGRITAVSGIVTSDGAQTLRMLGVFRVLQVVL